MVADAAHALNVAKRQQALAELKQLERMGKGVGFMWGEGELPAPIASIGFKVPIISSGAVDLNKNRV